MSDENIKNIVNKICEDIYKLLLIEHRNILVDAVTEILVNIQKLFHIEESDFLKQIKQNNGRDIKGIFIMLLPYYEFTKSDKMNSLFEITNNLDDKAKLYISTYYVDHAIYNINTIEQLRYFIEQSKRTVLNSIKQYSTKLMPNWLNIFPYTLDNYQKSPEYIKFVSLYQNKTYESDEFIRTIYNTIANFLYLDIKPIKWTIYNTEYNKVMYPIIIVLVNLLNIKDIINKKNLKDIKDEKEIEKFKTSWKEFISSANYEILNYVILFYLRQIDDNTYKKLNLSLECKKIIKIKREEDDDEELIDDKEYALFNIATQEACLKEIINTIDSLELYDYLFKTCQQFKYTWYGKQCMDKHNIFYTIDEYQTKITTILPPMILLKFVYNFFKSLIHVQTGDEYIFMGKYWNTVTYVFKQLFISRLNTKTGSDDPNLVEVEDWFSISSNLKKVYKNFTKKEINIIFIQIARYFLNEIIIPRVIFETLVYNGIFTYFKYNPLVTDEAKMPNKNKEYDKWKKHMQQYVDVTKYDDSYHFIDNQELKIHPHIDLIKQKEWYTNFGGDWICQMQLYHHFIHQRIMLITGATGAGKSTVAPMLLLYALKIINYNNNGKVFCTQPRIKPTKANAKRMAESWGVPFVEDEVNKEKTLNNIVDYVQYKYQGVDITDDYYHPTLRLLTDGSFWNVLLQNYLFKKKKSTKKFSKYNFLDILLVDEAHEHNTYMDYIMTFSRFGIYINNSVTFGIISATMDDDEQTYRKFFEQIDDNWKYPIDTSVTYDSRILDRRMHMANPTAGGNFEVTDIIVPTIKKKESTRLFEIQDIINVLTQRIVPKIKSGEDVLIFASGSKDVKDIVDEINNNPKIPDSLIAIPFYSELKQDIRETYVEEIHKKEIRSQFRYDKKTQTIESIKYKDAQIFNANHYKNFVIVATNIAEASITIETLKYVIETGTNKINRYDITDDRSILKEELIAEPNRKQRKGRVGRRAIGTVFYLYDYNKNKLSSKVVYKITIEDIKDKLLNTITETQEDFITEKDDPSIIREDYTFPDLFDDTYRYQGIQGLVPFEKFIKRRHNGYEKEYKILYPKKDGKYTAEELIDEDGKLYIIHPNEHQITRDVDLKITSRDPEYQNRVKLIFDKIITTGLVDANIKLTEYGKVINKLLVFVIQKNFEITSKQMIFLLEIYFYCNKISKTPEMSKLLHYTILFIVFSLISENIKIKDTDQIKAEFIEKSKSIDIKYYKFIDIGELVKELIKNKDKNTFDALYKIIENKLNGINYNVFYDSYKNKILEKTVRDILTPYFYIKTSLHILYNKDILEQFEELEDLDMSQITFKMEYYSKLSTMHVYEQFTYFVYKYYQTSLLIKKDNYYLNLLKPEKDKKFTIEFKFPDGKKGITTKLSYKYRNNVVYNFPSTQEEIISNLVWIPSSVRSV